MSRTAAALVLLAAIGGAGLAMSDDETSMSDVSAAPSARSVVENSTVHPERRSVAAEQERDITL